MKARNSYMTSLRMPTEYMEWFLQHSEKYNLPMAYFFRKSLHQYIQQNKAVGVAR